MVSFIDFYFHFLAKFQTLTSLHMFCYVTCHVTHSEPEDSNEAHDPSYDTTEDSNEVHDTSYDTAEDSNEARDTTYDTTEDSNEAHAGAPSLYVNRPLEQFSHELTSNVRSTLVTIEWLDRKLSLINVR